MRTFFSGASHLGAGLSVREGFSSKGNPSNPLRLFAQLKHRAPSLTRPLMYSDAAAAQGRSFDAFCGSV
jgi:hypothetical protein